MTLKQMFQLGAVSPPKCLEETLDFNALLQQLDLRYELDLAKRHIFGQPYYAPKYSHMMLDTLHREIARFFIINKGRVWSKSDLVDEVVRLLIEMKFIKNDHNLFYELLWRN